MKSIKVLVLTLFLAVTGYGYAADGNHRNTAECTANHGCCAAKAACCKPGAECCNAQMSCCANGIACCDGEKGCAAKSGNSMAGCCENCPSCCTADAGKTTTMQDAKGCCGSSACKGSAASEEVRLGPRVR